MNTPTPFICGPFHGSSTSALSDTVRFVEVIVKDDLSEPTVSGSAVRMDRGTYVRGYDPATGRPAFIWREGPPIPMVMHPPRHR